MSFQSRRRLLPRLEFFVQWLLPKKSFPVFSCKTVLPIVPEKKYKCAMLFSTRFRKRFRLKSRTTHRRPLASNVYFWDNSSCDTRFWTIINSMTEKSRMRCCLFSFSSRIYTERNIFPQVFFFIHTHKKGKNTCGNVIELSFRGGKDPLLFFKQSDK